MWELRNRTRYAADRSWTYDRSGAHLWLVAVKATFDIAENGKLSLADEQLPVALAPEFWGDPARSSLRFDADVTPPKPTTDVVLEASAYAPAGRATSSVVAAMRVDDFEKAIVVHGPRVYYVSGLSGLSASHAQPFVSCPIRYEEAYGGADLDSPDPRRQHYDARNPAGKGVTSDVRKLQHQPAHRIEYARGSFDKTGPAGFGPLASFWSPRREYAGTYDDVWEKQRKPLLPTDYDDRFLLSAPADQRTAQHLHGGEQVLLTNLTPHGYLSFQLPKIYLTFTSEFGSRSEEHRARLGTVFIAPDARKLTLVWNTALKVRAPEVDYLDSTIIAEKPYLT